MCGFQQEELACNLWLSLIAGVYILCLVPTAFKDETGEPLVEKILDKAGQKGTGKWTAISALDQGMPVTLIGESGTFAHSPPSTYR